MKKELSLWWHNESVGLVEKSFETAVNTMSELTFSKQNKDKKQYFSLKNKKGEVLYTFEFFVSKGTFDFTKHK